MGKRWKGPVPVRSNMNYIEGSEAHEAYKAKQRAHYYATHDEQRAAARDRVARKRQRNQQWLVNYLAGRSCEHCGLSDIRLLTFNHLQPDLKHANIADLVSRGAKLEHIIDEVAKCEVICHNCHMLVTFAQLGGSFRETMKPISEQEFIELVKELGL